MSDEPEAPPVEHTLDALRYMMHGLCNSDKRQAYTKLWYGGDHMQKLRDMKEPERSAFLHGEWRDEFNLTDEQIKAIGMDVGAASKGAIYVTTWTPEGLRYTEIPTADFYMPDPHGGNIGGNGSDGT